MIDITLTVGNSEERIGGVRRFRGFIVVPAMSSIEVLDDLGGVKKIRVMGRWCVKARHYHHPKHGHNIVIARVDGEPVEEMIRWIKNLSANPTSKDENAKFVMIYGYNGRPWKEGW